MTTHPYIPFKVVPNPASGVAEPIDLAKLGAALMATLKRVTMRNKDLIPPDVYERAKRDRNEQ